MSGSARPSLLEPPVGSDGFPPVIISLGSNIEPARNLAAALRLLAARARLVAVSPIFQTAPAAGASGPSFWNAAARIETELPPERLKYELLRPIEAELGRVRSADKNGPRTIDLDLTIHGELVLERLEAGLRIPDPDLLAWPHIAIPAAELLPDWVHPVDGRKLGRIAAALRSRASTDGAKEVPAIRLLGSAERVLGAIVVR